MTEPLPAEKTNPRANDKLVDDLYAAVSSTSEYAKSKLALAAVEAEIASLSVMMAMVLALCAAVLACSVWALLCFALAYWLVSQELLTHIQATLTIVGVNGVALGLVMVSIRSLLKSISFKHSLKN